MELANATGAKRYVLHVLRSLTDEVLTTLRENIPEHEVFRRIHASRLKHDRERLTKKSISSGQKTAPKRRRGL